MSIFFIHYDVVGICFIIIFSQSKLHHRYSADLHLTADLHGITAHLTWPSLKNMFPLYNSIRFLRLIMNLTTILKVNGKRELLENSLGPAKFLGCARNGQREAELDLETNRIRFKSDSIRKNRSLIIESFLFCIIFKKIHSEKKMNLNKDQTGHNFWLPIKLYQAWFYLFKLLFRKRGWNLKFISSWSVVVFWWLIQKSPDFQTSALWIY